MIRFSLSFFTSWMRSSPPVEAVFCEKDILKNFGKFTGKGQLTDLFF